MRRRVGSHGIARSARRTRMEIETERERRYRYSLLPMVAIL